MRRRGSVGRQMYSVLFFAIVIPIGIIGIIAAVLLVRQMNQRYEEQIKAENTRVKSILFDVTSSLYTNLEPIVSLQSYRDLLSGSTFEGLQQSELDALNRDISSLRRTTAAISSIAVYTNNPAIPSGDLVINVGPSGNEAVGDDADKAAGSGTADDPFSRFEWYGGIDPYAWDTYTCMHVPLNEYEDAYELTLVRRFNTGNSGNRAYAVVTISSNYLRNRLLTTDNYMLVSLSGYPAFFASEYDEQGIEMPEAATADPDDYNYLGDMMLDGRVALTYVSSFVPYKADNRFFVLIGDYDAHDIVRSILRNYLIVLLLAIAGPVIAIFLYSRFFTARVSALREAMHRASTGDYDIIESLSGDDELTDTFNDLKLTTEKIRENEGKYYEAQIREQQLINMQQNMEFKMLSEQINPHFLYNTLEAIRMQAIRGGDKNVATSVKFLAKIMHYVLESTGRSVSTLDDELKHVDSYMQIQRLRFGEKVNWNFYIAEDFDPKKYHILPLLLQPIVENAVSHGLKDMDRNGHVSVIVEYERSEAPEKKLLITVNDDGLGMSPEEVLELNKSLEIKKSETDEKGAGSIGLYNIHQRIKLYYGEGYGLLIRSREGKGTSAVLTLPADDKGIKQRDEETGGKQDERQKEAFNGLHE
ncbi:sensor histidine kinase [Butyrivibrio sp. WCD3002]|uniref:sensor histidine kinase n=1 Tax=Butyrivibrio sp. WCD3002 TaxID=1280676 RepID=UPI00041295B1|nr:sensor histidine kinase [Butyrivibrio sp. WCD3002]